MSLTQSEANGRVELDTSDLAPLRVFFNHKGIDYVLCEPDEGSICRYRNELTKVAKINAEGKPVSLGSYADTESLLVSMCCFHCTADGDPDEKKPVPQQQIKRWPSRLIRKLYRECRKMSGLDDDVDQDEIIKEVIEMRKSLSLDNTKILIQKLRASLSDSNIPVEGQEGNSGDSPESMQST